MKLWRIIIGLLIIIAAIPANANTVDLTVPPSVSIDYDPFTGLPGLEEMPIELTYTGPEQSLAVRLVITPEFGSDFRLLGSGEPIELIVLSNSGNMVAGNFEMAAELTPDNTVTENVTFKIPFGQYADAGQAGINLAISAIDVDTGLTLAGPQIIQVQGDVPSRAQTNFAGSTAGYENGIGAAYVDFGHLTSGDSRLVNFQVRGNANVLVSLSSENNGKMVNQENPEISPVYYSITADGIASDLSNPLQMSRTPARSLAGSSYPLVITIDPMPSDPFAGIYKDIITIDVTPQ